jgi:hypothetical protein
VKNDYGTEKEAWAMKGLEKPLKKKMSRYNISEGKGE